MLQKRVLYVVASLHDREHGTLETSKFIMGSPKPIIDSFTRYAFI